MNVVVNLCMCMCVWTCVWVYVCVYVFGYLCPSRSVCVSMFVCLSRWVHVCKYVCVHARSSSWRKDMVTTADRCWCEKGEVWAGKGGKRRRRGAETPESALGEPLISS